VVLEGGAVLGASALAAVFGRGERSTALAAAVGAAAARRGVPAALLLAVAHGESRGMRLALGSGGEGWIWLGEGQPLRSLEAAAVLIGASPAAIRRDAVLGIDAAAALLGVAARQRGVALGSASAAWREVLEDFHGGEKLARALYSRSTLDLLRAGFRGEDDTGQRYQALGDGGIAPELCAVKELFVPERPAEVRGAAFAPFEAAAPQTYVVPALPRRVRYVVVHTSEARFGDVVGTFRGKRATVASHYVIRAHDGFTLQMVDERAAARHARCFNDESIGIEHEGYTAAGRAWYSDAMYAASARLVADVLRRHGLSADRQCVVGHGEAPDCSDHVDPGDAWNWSYYLDRVRAALLETA
jgi:hypothetical protein